MDAAGNQGGETAVVIRGGITPAATTTPDPALGKLNQAVLDAEKALAEAQAQNNNDSDAISRLTDALQKAQAAAKTYVTVPPPTTPPTPVGDQGGGDGGGGGGSVDGLASSSSNGDAQAARTTTHASAAVSSIVVIIIVIAAFMYQHRLVMAKLDAIQTGSSSSIDNEMKKKKKKKNPKKQEDGTSKRADAVASNVVFDIGSEFDDHVVSETSFAVDGRGSSVANPTYDGIGQSGDESDEGDDITL